MDKPYRYNHNPISHTQSFWSIHGRMRRRTYALLSIPAFIVWAVMRVGVESVIGALTERYDGVTLLFLTMIELLPYYFLVFIGIKRLHDCDYKGWWILIPFVIAVIWFVKPTKGTNRFGLDPRNDYDDNDTEFETDYSLFGVIIISVLINMGLIFQAIDVQKHDNKTNQINQNSNHTPDTMASYDDIAILNTNNQVQSNNQISLVQNKRSYDNAVANINAVWNSLHPSTQDFLRAEQRAINKERETHCIAYGNAQSADKSTAMAYRYQCEVPLLNERAEYLKTQINTIVEPPAPVLQAQPLPQTGATNKPNLYGSSPLQIKTNTGSHYWVKIVNAYNQKDEIVSYFIRGGEILDVQLPIGTYMVKYAYGNTWYGKEYLFGQETEFAKADEVLEFYHGQGYVIELIQQINGNLQTTPIDESDF